MDKSINRRGSPRVRYEVTVQFAEDSETTLSEGLMVDVSSGGLVFGCDAGENCPSAGQHLVTNFSIPSSGAHDSSSMVKFTRTGRVLRVEEVDPALRHVAIQFDEPLPVGKVFFDSMGLYRPTPAGQAASTDDNLVKDEDRSLATPIEQRIEELEHELAALRQLRDAGHRIAK